MSKLKKSRDEKEIEDLKYQIEVRDLDRKTWVNAYYRLDNKLKECYSLCESCQSRIDGLPKPVQNYLEGCV